MLSPDAFAKTPYPDLVQYVEDSARVVGAQLTGRAGEWAGRLATCTLKLAVHELVERSAGTGPDRRAAARLLSHIHIHGIENEGQVETGAPARLVRAIMEAASGKAGVELLPMQSQIAAVPIRMDEILNREAPRAQYAK